MKKLTSIALGLFLSLGMFAQELPQPSPSASFTQRVGLTDFTVNYSRPSVKGRTVFGDLVPYGEMWRTGANKATSITVSTDVMLGDQTLKAGTYSMFTIPNADEWVIIFNKDTELWGTGGYSQRNDALRMRVNPKAGEMTESFSISMENLSDSGADLVLAWDKVNVTIPVKVNAKAQSDANVQKALADVATTYRNAANYYSKNGEYDKALTYVDKSIELNNYWYTNWVKATILQAKGDTKAAKKQGELAIKIGEEAAAASGKEFNNKASLEKTMKSW